MTNRSTTGQALSITELALAKYSQKGLNSRKTGPDIQPNQTATTWNHLPLSSSTTVTASHLHGRQSQALPASETGESFASAAAASPFAI